MRQSFSVVARAALVALAVALVACSEQRPLTAPPTAQPHAVASAAPRLSISGSSAIAPQVSAGNYHTCALKTDGTVVCWGNNDYGQATVPTGLASVAQVSAGLYHNCAVKTDGTVVCWGWNIYGQATVPGGLASVAQVSASMYHTCAVKTDGTVVCWGVNIPVPSGLASVSQVSAGYNYTCAVQTDGTVVCWGNDYWGQATVPSGLASVAQVSAGYAHTCALKTDGTVVCWGYNYDGQATVPGGLASVAQVSTGSTHTCAVKTNGTVVCWGGNSFGQATVPDGLASVAQVSAGYSHTCAVKTDGTVVCWGLDSNGETDVPAGLNLIVVVATPPVVTYTLSPQPNGAGWNNSNVTVTWAVSDPESGIASSTGCTQTSLTAETPGTTLTCTATNVAGLSASGTVTVKIDKTPPTISVSRAPSPNSYGWNNSNVSASYTASDALSGLASPASGSYVFSVEGANQSYTFTVTDLAGNTASGTVSGVNIDWTPPTGTLSLSPALLWPPNHKLVAIAPTLSTSDNLSGVATTSLPSVSSNEPVDGLGDGDTSPDWYVTGIYGLQLRAERSGTGTGRIYTVSYVVTDRAGNSSAPITATVSVPKSQGR